MALRNLNFDSAIRGILEQKPANCTGLLEQATAQLAKCKLSADPGKAVTSVKLHEGRRNPERGKPVGSENFNARSIGEWIENVPETVPEVDPKEPATKETADAVKAAHTHLVAIHATLASRNPQAAAKAQADVKAKADAEAKAKVEEVKPASEGKPLV